MVSRRTPGRYAHLAPLSQGASLRQHGFVFLFNNKLSSWLSKKMIQYFH
jgi:hypothetical protein